MALLTIILIIFTAVLYLLLYLNRKEIIIAAKRQRTADFVTLFFAGILGMLYLFDLSNMDTWLRGAACILILLSFIYEKKGLTEERFILNAFDKNGVSYDSIDKMILQEDSVSHEVRLLFFRNGRRGGMLRFSVSVEDLLSFFNGRLKEGCEIEVVVNQ